MDKLKSVAKGGWQPANDRKISRDTWKSDVKGIATGKGRKDPDEEARANHQARPLNSLRDPSSFGAPPKHSAYYGSDPSSPSTAIATSSGGGLGSAVPAPVKRPTREEIAAAEEEANKPPPGPYRVDTSGLRTDNLPKPPVRRADGGAGSPVPAPPLRAKPAVPQRAVGAPPPVLPPRQNEYPDEYAPPPPPTYGEATQAPAAAQNPATLNQGALNRLGQAGVSVPGFGIRSSNNASSPQTPSTQGHSGQLSELQQRFSRMGTGTTSSAQPPSPASAAPSWQQRQAPARTASPVLPPRSPLTSTTPGAATTTAGKKPPPPPPKKNTLTSGSGPAPPPIPMSSKPKPS